MPDTNVPAAAAPDDAPASDLGAYVPTVLPDTFAFRWIVPYLGGYVGLALLPVFLLAGVPVLAWAIAFGMWVLNTAAQRWITLLTMGLPATLAVGAAGMTMMLRVWSIALVLFFVGARLDLGDSAVGLGRRDLAVPAMLLFLVIFTFDVAVRSLTELHRYKTTPAAAGTTTPREELA